MLSASRAHLSTGSEDSPAGRRRRRCFPPTKIVCLCRLRLLLLLQMHRQQDWYALPRVLSLCSFGCRRGFAASGNTRCGKIIAGVVWHLSHDSCHILVVDKTEYHMQRSRACQACKCRGRANASLRYCGRYRIVPLQGCGIFPSSARQGRLARNTCPKPFSDCSAVDCREMLLENIERSQYGYSILALAVTAKFSLKSPHSVPFIVNAVVVDNGLVVKVLIGGKDNWG